MVRQFRAGVLRTVKLQMALRRQVDGGMQIARRSLGMLGATLLVTMAHGVSAETIDRVLAAVTLFCLVAGSLVSYAKARAESLGLSCDVGFAERTERLLIGLTAAGLSGLGVPYVLPIGLWALAAASAFTFGQRVMAARRSAAALGPGESGKPCWPGRRGNAGRRRGWPRQGLREAARWWHHRI